MQHNKSEQEGGTQKKKGEERQNVGVIPASSFVKLVGPPARNFEEYCERTFSPTSWEVVHGDIDDFRR